ncbi:3-mercaptopyruvate sulfurtransferase [Lacibacterium aquatile]|uniref:Sulfurtransferase n=1 Tax=Lacibacterium aquatile TaxID=1168082 RepID=A0ABW5DT95_9PROT
MGANGGRSALVSTQWLADNLDDPKLRILDATYFLPGIERDADAEFQDRHIPGAQRFDVDFYRDESSDLPHMLPEPESFAAWMTEIGIGSDCFVVCYDTHGLLSAARPWWMFRVFGHDKVAVLDGGLPKWLAEGRPIESGEARNFHGVFQSRFRPELLADTDMVAEALEHPAMQVVDARSAERFAGTAPEPRAGLRSGHMPGARSLPTGTMINPPHGTLKSVEDFGKVLEAQGIDPKRKIIASCGSGVTACIAALAFYEMGKSDVAVYDGSWSEWGALSHLPVATGAA